MKSRMLLFIGSVLLSFSLYAQQNEASELAVMSPHKTYIGAVLDSKSINTDEHQFVKITVPDAVTVSSDFARSKTIIPSYDNMMEVVREWVKEKEGSHPAVGFSFQGCKKITSYDELYRYFGQKINTETIFGIPQGINPTIPTYVVNLSQVLFTMSMDIPDDGKLHEDDPLVQGDNLVYLNSISFGRKVIIIISSSLSESEVKSAIKEAFSSESNMLSAKSQSILSNSNIEIMTLGADLPPCDKTNPFAAVIDYFNRPITIEDFGVPILFTAAYIKDNSEFLNTY